MVTGHLRAGVHVLGVSGEVAELLAQVEDEDEVSSDEGGRRPRVQRSPSVARARQVWWLLPRQRVQSVCAWVQEEEGAVLDTSGSG